MNAFPRSVSSTSVAPAVLEPPASEADFLPLLGTDHVEFYVGNARQAAHFYRTAFGMSLVAYAGPETGMRDRASYVVQQGKVRFVLTTPLLGSGPIAEHIQRHGDGVRVIALWVDDAARAWRETTRRGAVSFAEPQKRFPTNTVALCSPVFALTATRFIRLSSAAPTTERFFPDIGRSRMTPLRGPQACSTLITWWATSVGTRWTSGSISMRM